MSINTTTTHSTITTQKQSNTAPQLHPVDDSNVRFQLPVSSTMSNHSISHLLNSNYSRPDVPTVLLPHKAGSDSTGNHNRSDLRPAGYHCTMLTPLVLQLSLSKQVPKTQIISDNVAMRHNATRECRPSNSIQYETVRCTSASPVPSSYPVRVARVGLTPPAPITTCREYRNHEDITNTIRRSDVNGKTDHLESRSRIIGNSTRYPMTSNIANQSQLLQSYGQPRILDQTTGNTVSRGNPCIGNISSAVGQRILLDVSLPNTNRSSHINLPQPTRITNPRPNSKIIPINPQPAILRPLSDQNRPLNLHRTPNYRHPVSYRTMFLIPGYGQQNCTPRINSATQK